ncbi:MAG: roadblock/LC7 domain-containing protein [Deltaproteobacteria bacterium]|nr:roadblock/LC7 domain-containing protein [Deltaproteobacteria bacterium]MBF0550781.1 roadblock/LC7 domain-containing protein [Deltaproteobacteria bacterium]
MDLVLSKRDIEEMYKCISENLVREGADCVLLIDRAANLIVNCGNPMTLDVVSLAALSAANFGATAEIARIIGEEEFSLLFHKGRHENIHFTSVGENYILITLFGKDVSLGLIRLKVEKTIKKLQEILQRVES